MKNRETVSVVMCIRITGILAIVAALANGLGDIIYQSVSDGVYDRNMEFVWRVSEENLQFGAYFGLFVIPLVLAGYWHV